MAENLPCRFDLCQTALKEAICGKAGRLVTRRREVQGKPCKATVKASSWVHPAQVLLQRGTHCSKGADSGRGAPEVFWNCMCPQQAPYGQISSHAALGAAEGKKRKRCWAERLRFWRRGLTEVYLTGFSTGTIQWQPISKGSKDGKPETLIRMGWGQRAALLFKYFYKRHKPSKRLAIQSQIALKPICHIL